MTTASSPTAVRRSDLAVAVVVTTGLFVAVGLAFAHASLSHHALLPVIDPGMGIAIAVRPVADLGPGTGVAEAGRPGADGRQARASVPRAWRRRPAPPSPVDPALPWSSAPEPSPDPSNLALEAPVPEPTKPITKPSKPRARATPADPVEPVPDPDALPDVDADPSLDPSPDPSLDTNPEEPAIDPEGEAAGETEAQGEGEGAGGPEGAGDGAGGPEQAGEGEGPGGGSGSGGDPLFDRAVAFYRARLVAWFSAKFRVSGSGLSSAELAKHEVRVQIDLDDDLYIVDYRILASDHPAFDSAARAMLDKLRGTALPPPPENYPGAVQRQLTVTFTCAEDSCD